MYVRIYLCMYVCMYVCQSNLALESCASRRWGYSVVYGPTEQSIEAIEPQAVA